MFAKDGGLRGASGPHGLSAESTAGVIPDVRAALSWNVALDLWLVTELLALAGTVTAVALIEGDGLIATTSYLAVGIGWVVVFGLLSWYHRSVQAQVIRTDRLRRAIADWVKASIVILVGVFLTNNIVIISRPWALATFAAGGAMIGIVGLVARRMFIRLSRDGLIGERIAIYGRTDNTDDLIKLIEANPAPIAKICAVFDERSKIRNGVPGDNSSKHDLNDFIDQIKREKIDTVVINLPWSAASRIADLVNCLEQISVNVLMAPVSLNLEGSEQSIAYVGGKPTLSLYRRRIIGLQAIGKMMLDRGAAAIALLILALPLLVIALIIKIDSPGAVLFRQKRRGMNNEPFDMLKFRSMHSSKADPNADKLVSKGDSRVTRVGAILRRTSIDELPQLVNVLLGHMSLVGPRPHAYGAKAADRLYEEVVRRYPARHRVLPGITGLAQVRGFRGNTEAESDIVNRVESDIEYIDRWTLALDIQILLRTAATFLFQTGAY